MRFPLRICRCADVAVENDERRPRRSRQSAGQLLEEFVRGVVVPRRTAQVSHAEPPADGLGGMVVGICDGEDLRQTTAECVVEDRLCRFGGVAVSPGVRM